MKTSAQRPTARAVAKPAGRPAKTAKVQPQLNLSSSCLAALRKVVASVARKPRAGKTKLARSTGTRVLFTGRNPDGALLAAKTLAQELALDLRRIDLGTVVSPYIGETEKNLNRIFAAAERTGVVLFFDEADALFGQRTGVRDSHDRYANLEVSYLLTKLEEFSGVAILSTQGRRNLDAAFVRRFQFVVPVSPKKTVSRPKRKSSETKPS